ncbi:ABC transporter permease [Halobacteriales archaeon SW_12_71_31]|nr:MAG: ABC transporter permease [Halobacteriales archaeon SW_12_71_31]
MATDTDPDRIERFEDIDWQATEMRGGLSAVSRKAFGLLLTLAAVCVFFLYDYYLVRKRKPTVPVIEWDVSQVDWMFMVTLAVIFFYVLLPLYENPRMTRYYWREFRKNRAAVFSGGFLLFVFGTGLVGPLLLPKPEIALELGYQPPVFTSVSNNYPIQCVGEAANGRCFGTFQHPLGTTGRGKDIFRLIVYGMTVSMQIGLITGLIIITIGTIVGAVAAYLGGLADEILMRYVDIQLTFPTFLLYLLLIYLFGQSLFMFILVFGVTSWGLIARLVRSEALQRTEEEYITAAQSAGAPNLYVIWRHILPNVSSTVITAVTLLIPSLLLFEAGLAFLQLGDPSIPSWGQVISAGRSDLSFAWWISTVPGVFLFFTILAFNFIGDALRDALDPRQTTQE